MNIKYIATVVLCGCLALSTVETQAGIFDRKKKAAEAAEKAKKEKKPTPYEKLFKDKKVKTCKGLVTLHKIDGKVYFEFPVKLFEKEMLLGSSVESISDNGEAIVGQKPHTPLHIVFSNIDSAVQIRYCFRNSITRPEDKQIEEAIVESNIPAVLESFDIEAWSPDSTAVVFDATKFLVSDMEDIDPFDPYGANTYFGWMARITNFKSDRSFIGDIASYEDNFSVSSHLSFGVTYRALGMFEYQTDKPFTAVMRRTFVLLPEDKMRPRIADPRIGVFPTGKMMFTSTDNGMKAVYYANHFRLEPSDLEAWKRGEKVDPIKPIVFYIDDKFPEMWKKYIKEGIEGWNIAFEQIGFKNAVQTKPFPKDDPEFSTNNLKYSCVNYAPSLTENAMGPSWVDPRTGEILNASVYVYHNLVNMLYNWRFIQTAAVDPSVRTKKLPEEVMGDAIRYVARHEVGHCLGLMHNMAASSAFPVDSLRSPSFTQKYGTTPSIMDYARFNYVAQPGDLERGVKLTPPILGAYDMYAIKWLYSPLPDASTPEEEVPTLSRWISEKAGDPLYRYGKQQIRSYYDPSAQTEDLGDNAMKASAYGIKNLKIILTHLNEWLEKDDKDCEFRRNLYYEIVQQLKQYLDHVSNNLGGIYLNERYAGDPNPTYRTVSKERQKEALHFLLDVQGDLAWLDNEEITTNFEIAGPIGVYMQNQIITRLVNQVSDMQFSASKAEEDPYTEQEYMDDIVNYIMAPTRQGKKLSDAERKAQIALMGVLISSSEVNSKESRSSMFGVADPLSEWLNYQRFRMNGYVPDQYSNSDGDISGFEFQSRVRYDGENNSALYYGALLEMKRILENARVTSDQTTRDHYGFMLYKINNALKVK